jgi:hypothetical protein
MDHTRYILVIALFLAIYLEPPFALVRARIGPTVREQR